MAKKGTSDDQSQETSKSPVTRIKATDTPRRKNTKTSAQKSGKPADKTKSIERKKALGAEKSAHNQRLMTEEKLATEKTGNIFVRFGRYVRGAWRELMEVRWPTRRATWGLTLAVLIFTAFFAGFILALDALFNWLSQMVLS